MVTSFDANDVPDDITTEPADQRGGALGQPRILPRSVLPVAEKAGVKLSMHPDDPPLSPIRGVGRIMRSDRQLPAPDRHGAEPDEHHHALPGQFHPDDRRPAARDPQVRQEDLLRPFPRRAGRARRKFEETWHDAGKTDMLACMRAYRDIGFDGVLRPDHVPTVEGDSNEQRRLFGLRPALRHRLHPRPARGRLRETRTSR